MTSSFNSNMVADHLKLKYLSFVLGLIESRDWERLHEALSFPTVFQMISKAASGCEELNGTTLLHACVRCDPPVEVLARMIEIYPRALREEDILGRTPLHIAAGSGASPRIIQVLAVNRPQACDVQDEDGRTPLHLACDTSVELYEDGCPPRDPPSLDTVKILLSGSLKAAAVEDEDGMNAVEYAIISDASMQVVSLLQRASQRVMKRTKMTNDEPMHDDVPTRSTHQMGVVRPRLSVH